MVRSDYSLLLELHALTLAACSYALLLCLNLLQPWVLLTCFICFFLLRLWLVAIVTHYCCPISGGVKICPELAWWTFNDHFHCVLLTCIVILLWFVALHKWVRFPQCLLKHSSCTVCSKFGDGSLLGHSSWPQVNSHPLLCFNTLVNSSLFTLLA